MKSLSWAAIAVVLPMLVVAGGAAQTPTPAAPAENLAFDVVSVKPNTLGPGTPTIMSIQPGGRYTASNVPVTFMITNAYRLQGFQLIGAPGWAASEHFDISAKAPEGVNLQQPPNPDPKAPPVRSS